jgi:hypothetical protein
MVALDDEEPPMVAPEGTLGLTPRDRLFLVYGLSF